MNQIQETPKDAHELLRMQIEHSTVELSSDMNVKCVQCMCRHNDGSLYTQHEALLALKNPLVRLGVSFYLLQFESVLSEF